MNGSNVRKAKIQEARAKIHAGTAEMDFKLEVVVDRLLTEILSDQDTKKRIDRKYRHPAA